MGTLTQCEYQVANEVAKGQTPDEIADLLKKSIWTIKAQIRDIHKKLGINNNVELTLYLLCDRAKRNFDLKEIRKHGLSLFFSLWFLIIALFPDIQTDMRRLRMRSGIRISIRTINPERGRSLVFAA
ncbi:helix-turn-helix transcriptional regulator [uncultured Bacteroides sp.]|uniref:helix-turn-helix transcriptional regulator n=1 Tax=uncultured Bacteroides sp. TaxID=162156 RepID=UPI002674AC81|nr:helix-turn-helix transcriptional regulator [uncultured Bacteroides sp.]